MIKKLFLNEKFYVFTYSFILCITLFVLSLKFWLINDTNWVVNFSNLIWTVVSIFLSFIGVWLTIILQSKNNEAIKMLKASGMYRDLICYFKEAIMWSFIVLLISIYLVLWHTVNEPIIWFYTSTFITSIIMNFRIIRFIFKIIEHE